MMRMTGRRISAYSDLRHRGDGRAGDHEYCASSRRRPLGVFTQHYYVAVGDSLSFGYQPNLDFSHGFADDLFADLQRAEVTAKERNTNHLENYACAGETSTTMINGGCRGRDFLKIPYSGPQLDAVIAFMLAHKGEISPVTFEIGANDVLPDWNAATCTASSATDDHIKQVDDNLTRIDTSSNEASRDPNNTANGILQRLTNALTLTPRTAPPAGTGEHAGAPRRPGDAQLLQSLRQSLRQLGAVREEAQRASGGGCGEVRRPDRGCLHGVWRRRGHGGEHLQSDMVLRAPGHPPDERGLSGDRDGGEGRPRLSWRQSRSADDAA